MNKETEYTIDGIIYPPAGWTCIENDIRDEWKGWIELPGGIEGHTGKYPNYQNLLFDVVRALNPKNILEIGFNAGHSACCFLNAAPKAEMVTFDICHHGTEKPAIEVLKKYFNIKLIEGDSRETVPTFFKENDVKFDFAFIDGGHQSDLPYEDMKNVKHIINIGGLLIIDDMGVGSVDECFNRIDWTGFCDLSGDLSHIEKNIVILKRML
tara:strand:+ start:511 stop:1140 length:630 start_codon:yes stop_codon:yes gene_type:complete